ncbi:MAG: 1-acyl-sn-glycerol-3-phosphate acyltransferase [Deltaproteobacteria bacterium]|nr:1-acyl-sn-glycerol-3-phosphate acyltransferase [Deltaproteobacteria bacterium]
MSADFTSSEAEPGIKETEGTEEPESPRVERRPARAERPELFAAARNKLSSVEAANVWWSRLTFSSPRLNALCAWGERSPGAAWVEVCTRRIRHVHGLDRIPPLDRIGSFVLVANHRSYFDLYVISMILFRAGLRRRILYPVRSGFFYDNPLGFLVNGAMSFWSMYPPIFRDKKRAVLNHTALSEVIWALKNSRVAAGIHPEGTRNHGDDPYSLLPPQSGVGRVIHESRVPVIPVFINGLGNRLPSQILGNFTGRGRRVHVVFGAPVEFGELLDEPATAKAFRSLAEKAHAAIRVLGEEERRIREADP